MNPLTALPDLLGKLGSEHFSAEVQGKHIALLKEQFGVLQRENTALAAERTELKTENEVLKSENEALKQENINLKIEIESHKKPPVKKWAELLRSTGELGVIRRLSFEFDFASLGTIENKTLAVHYSPVDCDWNVPTYATICVNCFDRLRHGIAILPAKLTRFKFPPRQILVRVLRSHFRFHQFIILRSIHDLPP